MGKLDNLKIGQIPKAFLPFAQRHNALVAQLERMQGGSGIDIQVSEVKTVVSLRPTAIQSIGQATSGSGSNINGNTTLVVGPVGTLIEVYTTGNTNGNYATTIGTDGVNRFRANSTGVTITNGTNEISIPYASITRNMGIRTINVCNGNSSALMDIIASNAY